MHLSCRDLEGAPPAGQASEPDSRVVSAKLAVSPGGLVSVESTVIPHLSEEPFWVTPSSALVAGGQSQQFVVHFAASSAQQHDGYLLGTQRVDRTQEGQVSLPPTIQRAALHWLCCCRLRTCLPVMSSGALHTCACPALHPGPVLTHCMQSEQQVCLHAASRQEAEQVVPPQVSVSILGGASRSSGSPKTIEAAAAPSQEAGPPGKELVEAACEAPGAQPAAGTQQDAAALPDTGAGPPADSAIGSLAAAPAQAAGEDAAAEAGTSGSVRCLIMGGFHDFAGGSPAICTTTGTHDWLC